MSQHLAVTVIGNDRPGIVAAVTKVLFDHGCNLEDVSSTILRGHFSMVMIVKPGSGSADDLEGALAPVAEEFDLVISARPVAEAELEVAAPTHMVSVYGADKPGIVFRVATAMAEHGANVTDLTSRVIGPEDDPVYALMLEVSAPEGDDLAGALEALKEELAVDVTVHPIEADIL